MIVGVLALSLNSPLASMKVLQTIDQHRFLLESALADSHGYKNVTILGVSSARRLREAINTQLRVGFEAEVASNRLVDGKANPSRGVLEKALQESFGKAGLDLQVQSAAVEITSAGVSASSSQSGKDDGPRKFAVLVAIIGVVACACAATLCLVRRRSARSAAAKECGDSVGEDPTVVVSNQINEIKEKHLSETDVDLASVSTGTPSTHSEVSEP